LRLLATIFSKTIEEELVSRVAQPVSVSRLISQNTIEDKILSSKERDKILSH
jgi:SNF2 family DNA or RNA helicase